MLHDAVRVHRVDLDLEKFRTRPGTPSAADSADLGTTTANSAWPTSSAGRRRSSWPYIVEMSRPVAAVRPFASAYMTLSPRTARTSQDSASRSKSQPLADSQTQKHRRHEPHHHARGHASGQVPEVPGAPRAAANNLHTAAWTIAAQALPSSALNPVGLLKRVSAVRICPRHHHKPAVRGHGPPSAPPPLAVLLIGRSVPVPFPNPKHPQAPGIRHVLNRHATRYSRLR